MRKSKIASVVGASITVEACFNIPIFLFSLLTICSVFICIITAYKVERELSYAVYGISPYLSELDGIPQTEIPIILYRYLQKEEKELSGVVGGSAGINLKVESYDNECLDLICTYSVKIPIPVIVKHHPDYSYRLKFRAFSGTEYDSQLREKDSAREQKEQTKVYITESGKVYHQTLKCPSLKVTITGIPNADTESARNETGGKYYACEKCAKGEIPAIVYITPGGSRYHYKNDCQTLVRNIREVQIDSIPGRRECRRCYSDN